ncbi:MAG: hypothetical protein NTX82_00735, partial [Candidatus Parcubacteria bacterium]|nr:hypothetical protein [Candidatus Parcubacteria bacterium]
MHTLFWAGIIYLAIGHYVAPFMVKWLQNDSPIESTTWRIILNEIFAFLYLPLGILAIIIFCTFIIFVAIYHVLFQVPYHAYKNYVLEKYTPA